MVLGDARGRPVIDGAIVIRSDGIRVGLIPHGASVVAVDVPDRDGVWANVVVALESAEAYRDHHRNEYLGAMVGRYANRIAGAAFDLDGTAYPLDANNGPNTLHGGADNWARRDWTVQQTEAERVVFQLESPDGDGGFPGDVITLVEYAVSGSGLTIQANSVANGPTVLSLTNHTYWNLAGADGGAVIDDHVVETVAEEYLLIDEQKIPTGERGPVADLLGDGQLGSRVLDHCLTMPWDPWDAGWEPHLATHVATLSDPGSGRRMWMRANQPGLQVYTSDTLGIGHRRGVALEAQQLPDAPHHRSFPSTVVRPGDGLFGTVRWSVAYHFDTID
jgi:aldose 1-epimerase